MLDLCASHASNRISEAALTPATFSMFPVNSNSAPEILTTTVGSYSQIPWLLNAPSQQAVIDATAVVINTQKLAGIDLPTDGELYRFDPNHPETNGMIEYFVWRIGGINSSVGRAHAAEFRAQESMGFRLKPAGVVLEELSEGTLDLPAAYRQSASVAGGALKFTLTSPFMLARTLLDKHYGSFEKLTLAIADVLAAQVAEIPATCIQVDEANIPGAPQFSELAAEGINRILDKVKGEKAVHFCFGNYGGQTIQKGTWNQLTEFLNSLRTNHLVLELAHRPESDLDALAGIRPEIDLGIGVVDIKVNHIETPDEIAARIEKAVSKAGAGRVRWVHPDCGFWMLNRSVADRKIRALVEGRNRFLGISS